MRSSGLVISPILLISFMANAEPVEIYAWSAPPAEVQASAATSPIPTGQGALFIPSITAGDDEPDALVADGNAVVRVPIGQAMALKPGSYVVLVGSGDPRLSTGVPVDIVEGQMTVLPVQWGGLVIESVSRKLDTRSLDFELIHVETGDRVELPEEFRTSNSTPKTWLLRPGLYRIQQLGAVGVERPDFATVSVPQGGLVRYRVFVGRGGAMLGGGVISPEEVVPTGEQSPWTSSLILGAEGAYGEARRTAGAFDQIVATGTAFVDASIGYSSKPHEFSIGGSLAEGLLLIQPSTGEPLPLIKTRDSLVGSASYTFLLNEGVGAFIQGSGATQVLPTEAITTDDTTVEFENTDGTVETVRVDAGSTYRIAEALSPTVWKSSTGLKVRLTTIPGVSLSIRGGVGYRSYQYGGAYIPNDDASTDAVEYVQAGAFSHPGAVAGGAISLKLARFATLNSDAELFIKPNDLDSTIIEWSNALNLRITSALSVNYRLGLARVPQVGDRFAVSQGLFLRASWTVL